MKPHHIIFGLSLFFCSVMVQSVEAERVDMRRLQSLYESLSPDDSVGIKKFLSLANQAVAENRKSGNRREEATACYMLGEYYNNVDLEKAHRFQSRGIALVGDERSELAASLLCNEATNLFMHGNLEQSKRMFLRTVKVCEEIGDRQILSTAYTTLGIVCRRFMQPDTALFYYNKALQIVKKERLYSEEANLLGNIAVLYSNQNRHEYALNYARQSVTVADRSGDKEQQMQTNHTLGSLLMKAARYGEAKNYLKRSLEYATLMQSDMIRLGDISFLVTCYDETNQLDSAMLMIDVGDRLSRSLPMENHYVLTFVEIKAKHDMKHRRWNKALQGFLRIKNAQNANSQITRDVLYRHIADCYAGMGKYKEAFSYSDMSNFVRDTLLAKQTERQMSEFATKYGLQKKEILNMRLKQHNAEQKTFILGLVIVVSILSLIIAALLYRRKIQRMKMKALERQNEMEADRKYIKGLEDEQLRLAREMHDGVCNDLMGIEMALKMRPETDDDILEIVKRSREEVRLLSHRLMPPKFTSAFICQLLADMAHTADIHSAYSVTFKTNNPDLQTDDLVSLSLYRIVQEMLNNIETHAQPSEVNIALNGSDDDTYILSIENDGVKPTNCDRQLAYDSNGIGEQTIYSRIRSIDALLTKNVEKGTYRVIIKGPVKLK